MNFRILGLAIALLLLAVTNPSSAKDRRIGKLPERYQEWLVEVDPLISKEERGVFLDLEQDHQRDGFVESFWQARDTNPATEINEYRDGYYARREAALERYGSHGADQARIYITHGDPSSVLDYPNGCGLILWPLQVWRYQSSPLIHRSFTLLFYAPQGGSFRLWRPHDGISSLTALPVCTNQDDICLPNLQALVALLWERCKIADEIADISRVLAQVQNAGPAGVIAAEAPPRPADEEWLTTFRSFSTDRPEAAAELEAVLELTFPSRHQNRTIVRGGFEIPIAGLIATVLGERSSYNLELTGEVLRDGSLFESFRYRFDLPLADPGVDTVGLVFERFLRPGEYSLVVKLDDLGSGRVFRRQTPLVVPRIEDHPQASAPEGETADAATDLEERPLVRIVAPERTVFVGPVRFDAEVSGEGVRRVQFLLDEKPVLTKTRPPFSVEFNLGSLPRTSALRVVALDARGEELASDELVLNAGEHTFAVRLVEPRRGRAAIGNIRARAEVLVPEGEAIEKVEFFLGDRRLAALYQEPFTHRLELPPGNELTYVRTVATLRNGRVAEDLVVVRGSPFQEEIEVRTVELYAAVLDDSGRPVAGLSEADFEVREDGRAQSLVRFAEVRDLPFHTVLLVDTSASMEASLGAVRTSAFSFLERNLGEQDRAAVITFSNEARLAAPFTRDLERLAGALAGIKPEQSTALNDSLVFALYYFRGIQGQRALLVLSDGRDEGSQRDFDEVLELASRSGVSIYTVGVSIAATNVAARARLRRLSEETGGRALFVDSAADLKAWYASVAAELRSRYLLVYQSPEGSSSDGFRTVEVLVHPPGLEVRAPRGYLP